VPGRLQLLGGRLCRQRFLVRGQPNSCWQPTRHGLELEKLDQQDDHNDRDRLRHDGGERPENWSWLGSKSEQRETNAKQHSERPSDQAEKREQAGMRRTLAQHTKAHQNRQRDQRHGVCGWGAQRQSNIGQPAWIGRHRNDGQHKIEH
jgi:hypothetical protein